MPRRSVLEGIELSGLKSVCRSCGLEKPVEHFIKSNTGYTRECRPCFNKRKNEDRIERNKPEDERRPLKNNLHHSLVPVRTCIRCGVTKNNSEFHWKTENSLSSYCKDCSRDNYKTYAETNPDKIKNSSAKRWSENSESLKEVHKQWQKENPEKVRANSARHTEKIRNLKLEKEIGEATFELVTE